MEIESMKSGAAASYQGSAAASTKTLDAAVQPEASTQAGLSQTADKKPTVQNFFTEKDQEDKDLSFIALPTKETCHMLTKAAQGYIFLQNNDHRVLGHGFF